MLKLRLIFGFLMTIAFVAICVLDAWIDGSLTSVISDDREGQALLLCILGSIVTILAQLELKKLAAAKKIRIFTLVSIPASILLSTTWYWSQFTAVEAHVYVALILAVSIPAILICQHKGFGLDGVIANCGATCFSILYIGGLLAFLLAIRIDFGLWHLLMFVFTVKCTDIGAYTAGRLFGKHKFSPMISPKKTWEGMVGGIILAIIVSSIFASVCDIMTLSAAMIFGVVFAFIGQLGDLAESMIKRDAEIKDSSANVPGFGGVMDVIDSVLVAAVFAYLFFMVAAK
jgi:phosphatidate cytidylyltransferase